MSIEAMKQALEALEKISMGGSPEWANDVIPALRQAIEQAEKQQALDKKADNARELGLDYEPEPMAWMTNSEQDVTAEFLFSHVQTPMHNIPLYTAPPQADKQEPVANRSNCGHKEYKPFCQMCMATKQKPVAWVCEGFGKQKHNLDYDQEDVDALPVGTMLYAAPPRKEWVGLTDDEIWDAYEKGMYEDVWFARAIEAKLKEKNT